MDQFELEGGYDREVYLECQKCLWCVVVDGESLAQVIERAEKHKKTCMENPCV